MSLWPKNNLAARLEKARAEAAKLTTEITAQQTELDGALIAEPPNQPRIEKLELALAEKRRKAERQQHTVTLLEREAVRQERAAIAAQKAREAERAEAVVKEWQKNAAALETAIADFAALYQKQVELGVNLAGVWRWTNGEIESLKLTPGELKPLVSIEMFRAGAIREPAAGDDGRYILPGGVAPFGDRLQPHKIPSLSDTLRDRAQFAIDRLRQSVAAAKEAA